VNGYHAASRTPAARVCATHGLPGGLARGVSAPAEPPARPRSRQTCARFMPWREPRRPNRPALAA
jgi:hypothetical protein